MTTAANCSVCGAPQSDGALSNRCPSCAAQHDLLAGPPPGAATQQMRSRPVDDGRILRTGALPSTPTMPVSTMPRLMTADVEAAASVPPVSSHDDDAFTLADTGAAGATREAWSIGEDSAVDESGEAPAPPTRTALPRALVVTAGLVALIAVGALLSVTAKPGLPANEAGSGATVNEAARGRDGSGSGTQQAATPAPGDTPTKRSQRPLKAPASATRTVPDPDPAPALALPTSDPAPAAGAPEPVVPPPDFAANMRAGRSALDKGNLSAALMAFKAAAALRPKSAEAVTGIARAQAGGDQNAEAIKSFETAVVLNPDYTPAWSGLAHLRETSGNRDGAIDAYRRVVAISPDSHDAQIAREVLDELGATAP